MTTTISPAELTPLFVSPWGWEQGPIWSIVNEKKANKCLALFFLVLEAREGMKERCLPMAPGNEWKNCFCQQALPGEDGECHYTWHATKAGLAQVLLLFKKRLLILEDTLN